MLASFTACDDNTVGLGSELMPDVDEMNVSTADYTVTTKSVASGPVLSRTSTSYLGKYTDPETNTDITAEFLAQFHCLDGFDLPEKMEDTTATRTELKLYFNSYLGDSLSSCEVAVYPLNKVLDNNGNYYSDIDPTEYYDATLKPIARKVYTAVDHEQTDSTLYEDDDYDANVSITLPNEIGTKVLRQFYSNPELFANSKKFIENICKGYYVKFKNGDGTILSIDAAQFNIYFNYYEDSSTGELDSLVAGVCSFGATEEVIQATKFSNNNIQKLVDDNSCTYIKSPAGIFTEATLPIDEIEDHDSINSAKIILTRYNDEGTEATAMQIPQTLMMIRKANVQKFFENDQLTDSVSSYLCTFSSTYNSYTFSNISRLLTSIKSEKEKGVASMGSEEAWEAANPDWNKVLIIPVEVVTDSNGNTVAIHNDLSIASTRLVGGKDKITLKVIYSKFANYD